MGRAEFRRAGYRAYPNGSVRPAACCRSKPCEKHLALNGILLEVRKSGKWQPLGVLGRDQQWVIRKEPGKAVEL